MIVSKDLLLIYNKVNQTNKTTTTTTTTTTKQNKKHKPVSRAKLDENIHDIMGRTLSCRPMV